jgi:F-type H+-transporting ATPase subunit delta
MQNKKISSRYAQSLLDITEEKNNLDSVYEDVTLVLSALNQNPELRRVIISPVIKPKTKLSILNEIFSNKIGEELLRFIRFIIEKEREEYLYDIMDRFRELRNEKLGIIDVEVKTAWQFTQKQTEELSKRLEEMFDKKVQMSFVIDKNVLGGFIAKVGDTLFDASVRNQLDNLKRKFLQGNAN